jgi:hypothetical protein
MPSTPRFRTPERSTNNSPIAAKISGTDAILIPIIMLINRLSFIIFNF